MILPPRKRYSTSLLPICVTGSFGDESETALVRMGFRTWYLRDDPLTLRKGLLMVWERSWRGVHKLQGEVRVGGDMIMSVLFLGL